MRLILVAIVLMTGAGCDKTIKEVRYEERTPRLLHDSAGVTTPAAEVSCA